MLLTTHNIVYVVGTPNLLIVNALFSPVSFNLGSQLDILGKRVTTGSCLKLMIMEWITELAEHHIDNVTEHRSTVTCSLPCSSVLAKPRRDRFGSGSQSSIAIQSGCFRQVAFHVAPITKVYKPLISSSLFTLYYLFLLFPWCFIRLITWIWDELLIFIKSVNNEVRFLQLSISSISPELKKKFCCAVHALLQQQNMRAFSKSWATTKTSI